MKAPQRVFKDHFDFDKAMDELEEELEEEEEDEFGDYCE